jgi:hypothetical protein
MGVKRIESNAARLLRISRQVAELEYRIQTAGSPDQARRLGVQLRDVREGLRLTQLKA